MASRIKRFFPMSLDINNDPEVWAFTDEFGDRALRTLVQVFAHIERAENRWRLAGDWPATLSRLTRQQPARVRRQVLWMISTGWLVAGESAADGSPAILSASKYWDFHKRHDTKRSPEENLYGDSKVPLRLSDSPSDILKSPARGAGPVDNSEKRDPEGKLKTLHQQTEIDALVNLAVEIGAQDRRLQQQLCQWTISMLRTLKLKREPPERVAAVVRASLEVVRKKIAGGYEIGSVFALLEPIFDQERTRYMQGPENEAHKKGPISAPARELMKGIGNG